MGIEWQVGGDVVLGEFVEAESKAAHGIQLHPACDGEHGVADLLRAESARREAPEEAGVLVLLCSIPTVSGALLVSFGKEDLAVEGLIRHPLAMSRVAR